MTATIEDRFEELTGVIRAARTDAESGKLVQLGDFEKRVSVLCKEALRMEPAKAQGLKPLIAAMIGELDALAESLNDLAARAKGKS